jgi:hypothetical protein
MVNNYPFQGLPKSAQIGIFGTKIYHHLAALIIGAAKKSTKEDLFGNSPFI